MNYRCYKCMHKSAYPGGHPCGICRVGNDQFEADAKVKESLNSFYRSFYGAEEFRKVKDEKMYKDVRFKVESISVDPMGVKAVIDSRPIVTVELQVDGCGVGRLLDRNGSGAELYAEIENRLNSPNYSNPRIKNVIFNEPATIVFWADGTKTVVKCQDGDIFDPEKGLTMAITKKALGNKGNYCNEIKKWVEPWYEKEREPISLESFLPKSVFSEAINSIFEEWKAGLKHPNSATEKEDSNER